MIFSANGRCLRTDNLRPTDFVLRQKTTLLYIYKNVIKQSGWRHFCKTFTLSFILHTLFSLHFLKKKKKSNLSWAPFPHSGEQCFPHSGEQCFPHSGEQCFPHSGEQCFPLSKIVLSVFLSFSQTVTLSLCLIFIHVTVLFIKVFI